MWLIPSDPGSRSFKEFKTKPVIGLRDVPTVNAHQAQILGARILASFRERQAILGYACDISTFVARYSLLTFE